MDNLEKIAQRMKAKYYLMRLWGDRNITREEYYRRRRHSRVLNGMLQDYPVNKTPLQQVRYNALISEINREDTIITDSASETRLNEAYRSMVKPVTEANSPKWQMQHNLQFGGAA